MEPGDRALTSACASTDKEELAEKLCSIVLQYSTTINDMPDDSSLGSRLNQLIRRANVGDTEALDKLLAKYRPYLRLVAAMNMRPLLRNRLDASDIVQQTCFDAFRGINEFRGSTNRQFHAWIHRILHNNVAIVTRSHTAQRRDVRREHHVDPYDSDISLQWHGPANGGGPVSRVIKGEAALQLAHALAELKDSQSEAIQMRFLEGCTLVEIAEFMQTTPQSVATLLDRGLRELKKRMVDVE